MKEIRINAELVKTVAKAKGFTPEEYVSRLCSISSGRKVCAHLVREMDGTAIFCIK